MFKLKSKTQKKCCSVKKKRKFASCDANVRQIYSKVYGDRCCSVADFSQQDT